MQLGFVIDHSKCIGCHACTVACKSENDVPVGSFRTWVKYTEKGEFPTLKRSFAVLRCNQCSAAPCVTICPVNALEKRASDGIVDVDPDRCIGCKSCMQGCPYDALYINTSTGTAEKCHFCAHRTERGLAPACAVVCPTEAIIPGDFDDPESRVSRLKATGELSARKVEAGTRPNVLYREVSDAGIDPSLTNRSGGYLWADQLPGAQQDAQLFEAMEQKAAAGQAAVGLGAGGRGAEARTTYDVEHTPLWGGMVSGYLLTKSLSAGFFLVGTLLALSGHAPDPRSWGWLAFLAALFLGITSALLVGDLKRPERFLFLLKYPNWDSWLARGTVILIAYTAFLGIWLLLALFGVSIGGGALAVGATVGAVLAALTAMYTAWLFAQAKGRVLWMRRGLSWHLLAQALVAGSAASLILSPLIGLEEAQLMWVRFGLQLGLMAHLGLTLLEGRLAPHGREAEYERTCRLITHGPYARKHWLVGVAVGVLAAATLVTVPGVPALWALAGVLALVGLFVEEDILVRAGQALPIS